MAVQIIYKQSNDVTDEMLIRAYKAATKVDNNISWGPIIFAMRQAMEAARKGEIERIEVEQDEDGSSKIEIDCSEVMEHGKEGSIELIQRSNDLADQTHIIIVRGKNITNLANALLELGRQVGGND